MSDDKFRRRRRKGGEYGSQPVGGRNKEEVSPTPRVRKPITILGLAKPSRATAQASLSDSENLAAGGNSQYELGESSAASGTSDKSGLAVGSSDVPNRPVQVMSKSGDVGHLPHGREGDSSKRPNPGSIINSVLDQSAQMQAKLAAPLEKQVKVKLVDDHYTWCDNGLELMLEQTDYLVVGAIGLQGCGKSTILSLLAGNTHQDAYRNYVFFPQNRETKEDCLFQTSGIDMFVTPDRVILLDTEPLLSASMMDCLLRYERKYPPEYSSLQNFVEMQSLQLLTFLLSVCNVVLIADDWFVDLTLLRLVLDAEMLKPSTQPSTDPAVRELNLELQPTVVFVHNKASRDDFAADSYFSMQKVLHKIFFSSKLKLRGGINMTRGAVGEPIINQLPSSVNDPASSVNLLLLPVMGFYKAEPEHLETMLPEYRGFPSFNTLLSHLRSQVLSAPRSPINHSTLSEKNWYHFAARMWETVKKSPLLSEYNRLLSNST